MPTRATRTATRRRDLKDAYLDGAEIVAISAPVFDGRADGRWPVLYIPRNSHDPQPWAAFKSDLHWRYENGVPVALESRPELARRYSSTEVEALDS